MRQKFYNSSRIQATITFESLQMELKLIKYDLRSTTSQQRFWKIKFN
jgi:hypothetical protein